MNDEIILCHTSMWSFKKLGGLMYLGCGVEGEYVVFSYEFSVTVTTHTSQICWEQQMSICNSTRYHLIIPQSALKLSPSCKFNISFMHTRSKNEVIQDMATCCKSNIGIKPLFDDCTQQRRQPQIFTCPCRQYRKSKKIA
jgi:hypothetical protein